MFAFLRALMDYCILQTEKECDCSRWFRAVHGIHQARCNIYKSSARTYN